MDSQRIYDTENEGDYCAFHARFNLLCYKTDITPMDHCKSGNNRTSRAVEETKFLAAEIDDNITTLLAATQANKKQPTSTQISQLVPTSGKLSPKRQDAAAAFFRGVGTQEMQEVNSGRKGSREYHNVAKRIPLHPDTIKNYRGVYSSLKLRYAVSNS